MIDLAEQARTLFDLTLDAQQIAALDTYAQELAEWNANRMNLTAITEPEAVRVRHFLDSLSLVRVVTMTPGLRLVDVGAGAGFPGLPLAIVFPHIHVTLMEATNKKLTFIQHIAQTLGLTNISTLHARAEDAGRNSHHRARYDVACARAVARLPVLLEYLLPLVRAGGYAVAMKGATAHDEAKASARALAVLQGQIEAIEAVNLPQVDDAHYLVKIKKTGKTPKIYPRKAGTPARDPIGTSN